MRTRARNNGRNLPLIEVTNKLKQQCRQLYKANKESEVQLYYC